MAGTLKEITENYEKLHRLQMIDVIAKGISNYVRDVVSRIEDDFDDCEDFDDSIIESLISKVNSDLNVLKEYL
ncbi:MAG: hypothetical protein LUH21_04595 [Clostridiales bacterium]|nr:hypothetical protein [Clostridiales bacterium]